MRNFWGCRRAHSKMKSFALTPQIESSGATDSIEVIAQKQMDPKSGLYKIGLTRLYLLI